MTFVFASQNWRSNLTEHDRQQPEPEKNTKKNCKPDTIYTLKDSMISHKAGVMISK